jgi:outer membrane protein TolC
MILAFIAALQVVVPQATPAAALQDSIPVVSLAEALRRATKLDPNYVAALGRVKNSEWGRRAAISAFVLPSLTIVGVYQKSNSPSFNVGTGGASRTFVSASAIANYELFAGGRRFADLSFANASLEGAKAGRAEARFASALITEAAYYDVLATTALVEVAHERLNRAEQQFAIARARVLSGATVQTDSLQLYTERTRAQVDLLIERSRLRVARLNLGSLIGVTYPVNAQPLGIARIPDLPLTVEQAVQEALETGPLWRVARAGESAAVAAHKALLSNYLPQIRLLATTSAFDEEIFPSAVDRSTISIGVSLPIWNGGLREIAVTQAKVNSDVATAIRAQLERSARRDVAFAFEAYATSRAAEDLARDALVAAEETYRVQTARYQGGATGILNLLEAQFTLSQAQAGIVTARQITLLALAGLEAMLGRRLFPGKE